MSYIRTSRDPKDKYFIFVEAYARPFYYGVRNVYRDARNEGKLSGESTSCIRLVYIRLHMGLLPDKIMYISA